VVAWLHAGETGLLSEKAAQAVSDGRLRISPMAELELQYLHEIGRLRWGATRIVSDLSRDIGLERGRVPFQELVEVAKPLAWTRDALDRLIVAEAMAADARLVTRDELIRRHYRRAIW
jgi:PIN domain nuclease of toxin-antitoxin system